MAITLPPVYLPGSRKRDRGDSRPWTIDDLTITVKSFLRWNCLQTFLDSVRTWYPSVPVVVVDDSLRRGEAYGPAAEACRQHPSVVDWVQLPFDSGLPAGRNAGVHACAKRGAPLTMICDDDYVFTSESDLHALLEILNESGSDLAAGVLRWDGAAVTNWGGCFNGDGTVRPTDTPWQQSTSGHWYRDANVVLNVFVAPTQTLRKVRWDPAFKIQAEHLDWMLSAWKAGLRIVYSPSCVVQNLAHHRTHPNDEYRKFRGRRESVEHFERKHGQPPQKLPITPEGQFPPFRSLAPEPATSPNLLLLTVGHTGSSVTSGLLQLLGWRVPDNDEEYHEPATTRAINDRMAHEERVPRAELEEHLTGLPRPWLLKDPRWCHTLDRWLPALAPYRPTLLYLERDRDGVIASYRRRNQPAHGDAAGLVDWRLEQAERHFRDWPWEKHRVRFEGIVAWAAAIDPARL